MAKLCKTGLFFRDFLKSKIPQTSFLSNGIGSFEVSPANYGQIRKEFWNYNRIITVPLVKSAGSREEGLIEIYNSIFPELSETGRVLSSHLNAGSYDIDFLRADAPQRDLRELLGDNKENWKEGELKIRDRVRLTFDVNYVHSLPEWVLKEPRNGLMSRAK